MQHRNKFIHKKKNTRRT